MIELDDLLRDELRERALTAEGATRQGVLLAGLDHRIRQARSRRRLTVAALAGVAVICAVALPATLLSPRPVAPSGIVAPRQVPLSDPSLTPPGWSPVAYLGAQISVPSSWRVGSRPVCGRGPQGAVIEGAAFARVADGSPSGCPRPANIVFMLPGKAPAGSGHSRPGTVTGSMGFHPRASHGWASSRVLGVTVVARGPLAGRVLATLTPSPLSVVLAGGPRFPVPRSWRWHNFGGIRFAAPGSWGLEKDDTWGDCHGPIQARTTRLTTATHFLALGCALVVPTAGWAAAIPGIVVAAGRFAAFAPGALTYPLTASCTMLRGMRACADWSSGVLLALTIHPPGRPKPILVEIGLASTGATARMIFDSIRPAISS